MRKELLFVLVFLFSMVSVSGANFTAGVDYNISCNLDSDCVLGTPEIDLECYQCPVCAPQNGSSERVTAYNKNWSADCSGNNGPEGGCNAMACFSVNYSAQDFYPECIDGQCRKVYLGENNICNEDARICEDGTVLERDPALGCEFPACPGEVECSSEGEMCGGIAGFACCSGLECELEGDFPDAGGTCVVSAGPGREICEDLCGDGVCQEVVCLGEGCPCVETLESCSQDCFVVDEEPEVPEEEGGFSLFWLFVVIFVVVALIIVGIKIAKWLIYAAIIAAVIFVLVYFFIL